jgi:DNA-binding Lrp family transcriptional regulator
MAADLDEVDRGILYLLQQDARRLTTREMAEQVDVSASTVRNRIEKMEEAGVIRGYYPDVDYDETGFQLHMVFMCSAPSVDRERLAREARDVSGVVSIQEVLDGKENVQIEAVGTDTDDLGRLSDELSALGLDVLHSKVLKSHHVQPFDHFGQDVVEERDAAP